MAIIIGVVIGLVGGVVGGSLITKVGLSVGKYTFNDALRRYKKRKLKKELSLTIDKLDYQAFLDVVYKIQNYDRKYSKTQYQKCQKQLKFSNKILTDKQYFLRRFDIEYETNPDFIKNVIREEIELSLSKAKNDWLERIN